MNRSRGPLPPQTDHADDWPELPAGEPAAPNGQFAPPPGQQAAPPVYPGEPQGYADPQTDAGWPQPAAGAPPEQYGQPPAYSQPAPALGYPNPMPQPPVAPQAYEAPVEYTQPPQNTAPPAQQYAQPQDYTAPADYTQPPQQPAPQQFDPAPAPGPAPQTAPPNADYAPQFDRYAPPPTLSASPDVTQPHQARFTQPPLQPGELASQYEQRGTIHDHGQLPGDYQSTEPHFAEAPQAAGAVDPSSYDLAQYEPAQAVPAAAAGYGAGQQGFEQSAYGQPAPPAAGQPVEWHDPAAPSGQEAPYGTGYAPAPAEQDGYATEYDDPDGEYEDAPRGSRGLLIAASLVGAIALGGGLAYGYKHFGSGSSASRSNGPKTITADRRPVKIKPKSPGGKVFRNKNRKVFSNRLRAGQGAGDNGVRKVPTLVINRNGNVTAPVARPVVREPASGASAPVKRLAVPGISVPGMTVTPPRVVRPRVVRQVAPRVPAARTAPTRVVALPKARPLPKPKVVVAAPVSSKPKVKRVSAPVAPPSAVGAGGYVALISSSKDKVRTLASFANMQQRFPGLLAGKQPEIKKIVIKKEGRSKGTWYRLRIGPPASRGAIKSLCASLLAKKGARECLVRRY